MSDKTIDQQITALKIELGKQKRKFADTTLLELQIKTLESRNKNKRRAKQ